MPPILYETYKMYALLSEPYRLICGKAKFRRCAPYSPTWPCHYAYRKAKIAYIQLKRQRLNMRNGHTTAASIPAVVRRCGVDCGTAKRNIAAKGVFHRLKSVSRPTNKIVGDSLPSYYPQHAACCLMLSVPTKY
jgi:hypothetical protein